MGYVRWLGHAAFEVNMDGYIILIDPWITNPQSPVTIDNYAGNVDLILVTHDHADHLGDTIELLRRNPRAKMVAIYELANYVASKVGSPDKTFGANIGGLFQVPGVELKIALTPALHSSSHGAPTGVVIVGKEATIYHAGDTGLFAEMKFIGELYKPKIALLPIGGLYTMDIEQAVKAVELIKPEIVIPMHYNTFPAIRANPEEFKRKVEEKVKEVKVVILKPGEKYSF